MKCKILGILKKNCFSAVSTEGDNLIVVTEGDIENITIDIEKEMEAFAEWTAIMQWIYDPSDKTWFQKHSSETKTTTKLRELWEQEMRKKED